MVARVEAYEFAVEWDHFDDGTYAVYDRLIVIVESPQPAAGQRLSIALSPNDLPEDSPLRNAGARLSFTLASEASPDADLAWGSIKDPVYLH